jgi:flagellin-like protein
MNPQTRKAVSPVIATVILVAVAITVSVGVSYWMGGISSQYTQFEKVEIQTAICTLDGFSNWVVTIDLKNTGSAPATITHLFVNNIVATADEVAPVAAVATITTDLTTVTPWKLDSGESDTVILWVGLNYLTLSSGTTIDIKLHSAGGMDYIKLVQLI